MAHAVSATFTRFEHMPPPAAAGALLLHVLVAFLLWWSSPLHHNDDPTDEAIEVTMDTPPPPPEPKPAPETPKPPPPAPKAPQPPPRNMPGLAPQGAVGNKDTHPKMELGQPNSAPPPQAEQAPQEKPATQRPPEQAMAKPAEPPPPPPPQPTLEKELPPVEAPPAPLTARDIPQITPPVPEKKPEPAPRPPQPQAQPARPPPQQLPPSPLSQLQRNAPSRSQTEQPRTAFINPADTYAMNTIATSYQHRIAAQIARYQADLHGVEINDFAVARFTIARNGALLEISIVSSSGKQNLDRGLIAAFQQVAPFPPLPAEIPGDSATFTLSFGPRYQRR